MIEKRAIPVEIFRPLIIAAAVICLLLSARLPAGAATPESGGLPAATEPPVGVARLVSARPGGRIGDVIPFILEIRLADGVVLDSGSLAGLEIRPESLPPELYSCTILPFDRQKAGQRQTLDLEGRLVIYAPGSFRVAPTRLVGRREGRDRKIQLADLAATALLVKIAGLQPEISTSGPSLVIPERLSPPKPPASSPGRVAAASYAGILFLLLALFCGIGVYLELRALRKPAPAMPETGEPELPAARLARLLADKRNGNDWRGVVEIDHRLRPLLQARFSLPARLSGGCGRSFAGRLSSVVGSENARKLELIYAEIDAVIARQESGDPARIIGIKHRLKAWLDGLEGPLGPAPAGERLAGKGRRNGI